MRASCCDSPVLSCPRKQLKQFRAHGNPQRIRRCADKLDAIIGRTQAHHMRLLGQQRFKISAHVVNLPLDGVARHGAPGPPLGNHGPQPNARFRKQRSGQLRLDRNAAMQCKVRCFCHGRTRQDCLELRSCLQTMHDQTAPNNGPVTPGSSHGKRSQTRNKPSLNRPGFASLEIRQPDACGLWRDVH